MGDTRTQILDLAEQRIQVNGFNGFSYLDLAKAIGIKTASIHYHFASKNDLAVAVVERVHEVHSRYFQELNATIKSPQKRLEALIRIFQGYVEQDRFCLCGMMAAELYSLSPQVRAQIDHYFADFETWLQQQFKAMNHKESKVQALRFLSALEGSLLLARLRHQPKIVQDAMKGFLTQ